VFLHVLDAAEQRLFAQVALSLVHADDHLDPREEALLETLRLEMGLDEMPDHDSAGDALGDLSEIGSRVVARVFMFELAGIVTADGEIHEDERAMLEDVCGRLDVAPDELERFLDFAIRAHEFLKEARALLGEGDV
jgi:tellurite resistance protein